jgi:protein TonB
MHANARQVPTMLGSPKRSALLSGLIHAAAIILIVFLTRVADSPRPVLRATPLFTPRDIGKYIPRAPRSSDGAGGSGAREETRAAQGRGAKIATRAFTPPTQVIRNLSPILSLEPALAGNPAIALPKVDLPWRGDPNAPPGRPSNGTGCCGGTGDGEGHGLGNHRGDGYGDGDDPNGVQARTHIAGSVVQPALLVKIEPEYSDEARRAKIQGTVVLYVEVNLAGKAQNIHIRQSVGLGLDERAIEAVAKWRFRPGTIDGKPAVMTAIVEVNFRLM